MTGCAALRATNRPPSGWSVISMASPRPGERLPRGAAAPLPSSLIPLVPTCPSVLAQIGTCHSNTGRAGTAPASTDGVTNVRDASPVPPSAPRPRGIPPADVGRVGASRERRLRGAGSSSPGGRLPHHWAVRRLQLLPLVSCVLETENARPGQLLKQVNT